MKTAGIIIGGIVLLLLCAVCFAGGAIAGGLRGWFTPVVLVSVENRSGEDVSNVVLRHNSDGKSTIVMLPTLKNGETSKFKYYAGNPGGYQIAATLPDGRIVKGGDGYVEGDSSTTEVISADKITGGVTDYIRAASAR